MCVFRPSFYIMSMLVGVSKGMIRPRGSTILAAAFAPSTATPGPATGKFASHAFSTHAPGNYDITNHSSSRQRSRITSPFSSLQEQLLQSTSSARNFFSSLLMTSYDDDEAEESTKTLESEWDVKGLKQEVNRLIMRSIKKVGKASTRIRKTQELLEKMTSPTGSNTATERQLQSMPDMDALELELQELQSRLQNLNQLDELLSATKFSKKAVLPPEVAQLALDLGVDDQPPQISPRGETKKKGPRQKNPPKTRLPYRRFYTVDKTEIRVRTYM